MLSSSSRALRCEPRLVQVIQTAHSSTAAALATPPKVATGKWARPAPPPVSQDNRQRWPRPSYDRPQPLRDSNEYRQQGHFRPRPQNWSNSGTDTGYQRTPYQDRFPPREPARMSQEHRPEPVQGSSREPFAGNSRWRRSDDAVPVRSAGKEAFVEESGRSWSGRQYQERWRGKKGGSLLDRVAREEQYETQPTYPQLDAWKPKKKKPKEVKTIAEDETLKNVFVPKSITVNNLARLLGVKQEKLVAVMRENDFEDSSYDYLLSSDDASLLAMEFGRNPVVDEEAAFDLYPDPPHPEPSTLPRRPPVVTIMGHVDHGKTTLLDTLRSASVAASESGGITQHIGAFSVPLKSLSVKTSLGEDPQGPRTITFLDTPGHAAFSAMRARGVKSTDIIVLVVAADDGVMPQTREVIELYKRESNVNLVVAINKCDKPGVDVTKIKHSLLAEGVELEEFGGDIPAVEVSGLTGLGLDNLMETISAVAEVADIRAERDTRAHGVVLEAKMDKGKGPIATVLVLRGSLKRGDHVAVGTTWAKVRQMTCDKGASLSVAHPGTPVIVAGWKDLPAAGDEAICGCPKKGADQVKRAIQNRIRERDARAMLADIQSINEKRKAERENRQEFRTAVSTNKNATLTSAYTTKDDGVKELKIVVKADVSGTVEAVVGAISGIGNKLARVNVVQSGVGDVTESDVTFAQTIGATILGFNIKSSSSMDVLASQLKVPLHTDTVIYRIIDEVRSRVAGLLPPVIEKRVTGEATFVELFSIKLPKQQTMPVAGCRITNGTLSKHNPIRVVRNGKVIHEGTLDNLRHLKKDVTEVRKGMECGLNSGSFGEYQPGDIIQCFKIIETPASL